MRSADFLSLALALTKLKSTSEKTEKGKPWEVKLFGGLMKKKKLLNQVLAPTKSTH
jgi:hypothetical protein